MNDNQNNQRDKLEDALADMTRWQGPTPELWRKALHQETAHPTRQPLRIFSFNVPRAPLAAAALLLIAVLVGIVMLPDLGVRSRPLAPREPSALRTEQPLPTPSLGRSRHSAPSAVAEEHRGLAGEFELSRSELAPPADGDHFAQSARADLRAPVRRAQTAERHIIRRTTMELHAEDVRAAFAQAILIPSAARGEYVQASSLTGDGQHSRAELTLRVAADRLDNALNELRLLGTVHAERATGDDVTTQVVDLDARLRSERRIEAELLELLDKRPGSPLADVMNIRRSLDEVRQRIEQLDGQRQNLSRMVSLATILVIIRPPDATDDPVPSGAIGDYFKNTLAQSWRAGTLYLADSAGFLLMLLIGGLIWWLPVAAATGLIVQRRRSAIARGRI